MHCLCRDDLASVETPSLDMRPYTGKVLAADSYSYLKGGLPTGYMAASYRRWLIDRTGGSTGSVKMRFYLSAIGVAPKTGHTLGLLSVVNGSSLYAVRATAVYDGSGSVEFTYANPQDGMYAVGISPDLRRKVQVAAGVLTAAPAPAGSAQSRRALRQGSRRG